MVIGLLFLVFRRSPAVRVAHNMNGSLWGQINIAKQPRRQHMTGVQIITRVELSIIQWANAYIHRAHVPHLHIVAQGTIKTEQHVRHAPTVAPQAVIQIQVKPRVISPRVPHFQMIQATAHTQPTVFGRNNK